MAMTKETKFIRFQGKRVHPLWNDEKEAWSFSVANVVGVLFSFLLSSFCSYNIYAQVDPPIRVEFESAKDQQDYKSVSLSKQGVAVFYQSAILSVDTVQWVFIQYDTNLVRTSLYKIKLPNLCQYIASDFSDDKLYLFLQKPAYKKDTLKNYLLEWNVRTHHFQLFDLHNYKSPYLTYIKVINDHLFMIIDEPKAKSVVYYNYKTHVKQEMQFYDDEVISVESFTIDTAARKTYACYFLKNKKSSRAELVVTDFSGTTTGRVTFPAYQDIIYNSVHATITGKDSLLVTGGYSNMRDKKQKGCYSGIYTLLFSKNRFSEMNTYSFGALLDRDSVFNTRNLTESNLTMNMYGRQSNGRVFAITHLFYPEYQHNVSSTYRGFGYYGYDPPTQVFMGFRFLNAYILEFDTQGLLMDEWFFPIQNVLTQSLYHVVNLHQDIDGNTLFFYVNKNEIVSQFMKGQRVLGAQTAFPVELTYKTDILEYSSNISMRHWYDNIFLLSGYQYIKNAQRSKGKRYVFFLNKLICD
jgi:hypothetical protein